MPAAKKKAAAKAPANEISLSVSMTTPDGSKHDETITIANATGCIPKSRVNNPALIMDGLVEALRGKYGRNHIKA